jgi:hypothetical protein
VFRTHIRSIVDVDPFLSAKQIYDKTLIYFFDIYTTISEEISFLPTFSSCRGFIYNEKHRHYLASTGDVYNFDLRFANTRGDRRFLYVDENVAGRMLIFCDFRFCEYFFRKFNNICLYMDGTFKSSPTDFYQSYIVYGKIFDQNFPLFFAFLQNKTTTLYSRLLTHIKEFIMVQNITASPSEILIDYECAMFNSIRLVFPETRIRGCYFHFGQAIWRKVCFFGSSKFIQ